MFKYDHSSIKRNAMDSLPSYKMRKVLILFIFKISIYLFERQNGQRNIWPAGYSANGHNDQGWAKSQKHHSDIPHGVWDPWIWTSSRELEWKQSSYQLHGHSDLEFQLCKHSLTHHVSMLASKSLTVRKEVDGEVWVSSTGSNDGYTET